MLPKQYRLTRSRDFARARRFGRSSSCSLIALYSLRTRSPEIRIGFSVSKRVGKATVRNLVKRRLREAARHHLGDIRSGQDFVVVARPAAAGASFQELDAALGGLLLRVGATRDAVRSGRNG